MWNCNSIIVVIIKGEPLSLDMACKAQKEQKHMACVLCSSASGSLMYAVMWNRPNIGFKVGLLSRFISNIGHAYWKIVKRILCYLKGTNYYYYTIIVQTWN